MSIRRNDLLDDVFGLRPAVWACELPPPADADALLEVGRWSQLAPARERCTASLSGADSAAPEGWLPVPRPGEHLLYHAGAVALATGSVALGACEFVAHWLIDVAKCVGLTGIHTDQCMHIACKLLWVLLLAL